MSEKECMSVDERPSLEKKRFRLTLERSDHPRHILHLEYYENNAGVYIWPCLTPSDGKYYPLSVVLEEEVEDEEVS